MTKAKTALAFPSPSLRTRINPSPLPVLFTRKVSSFIHFTPGFRSLCGSELTYFWKLCQARQQQLTFFNQAWEIGPQAWAGVRLQFSTRRCESWQVYNMRAFNRKGVSYGKPNIYQGNQIYGFTWPAFETVKTWNFFNFKHCLMTSTLSFAISLTWHITSLIVAHQLVQPYSQQVGSVDWHSDYCVGEVTNSNYSWNNTQGLKVVLW